MLQLEILIPKSLDTVDGSTPRAIAMEKVTALDHKVFDLGVRDISLQHYHGSSHSSDCQ